MSEKIPKGWKWVKLGDVVIINPNETLKKGIIAKKVHMEALHPFTKKVKFFVFEKYNGGVKFKNGDTLVARITPSLENGKTVYVDLLDDDEIGFGSTEFIVLREKNGITDKQFVYYFAISNDFRDIAIKSMTGSSGRQRVQNEVVKEFEFLLPPLLEQKAIAEVLSSIDDKIDLLHRQNKTLEEMAMTLFRQWFIEPTKDGLPEGWEEKSLDEIAEFLNGIPSQKYHGDKLPVIKIKEMREGITESSDYCNNNVPEKYLVNSGDILFSWSGSLEVVIWFGSIGVLNQHIFKVTSLEYPKWFCYLSIKQHIEEFRAIAESKTTTMGHIQREHLSNTKVFIPPKIFFENYNKAMTPIFDKIIANNAEIQTLEKLRDTLLPKLMSGEVRVKVENNELKG